MPVIAALLPAQEHGGVLGHGDLVRGLVEACEIGIRRTAVVIAELVERDSEVGAELDQRQHAPLQRGHAFARCLCNRCRTAEVGRGVLPSVRAGEVDQLAGRQRGLQSLLGLLVQKLPSGLADRGE